LPLSTFLDAMQLMLPEALKGARPLVERPDGFRVGSIEHPAALAAHVDQANVSKDAKVF
jgi:hypothetical protein